jgi:hypothetical protein
MPKKHTTCRRVWRAPMSAVRGGSEDDERLDRDEENPPPDRRASQAEAGQSGTRQLPGIPARRSDG